MNTSIKLFALLAVLCFAACKPDPVIVLHERDIIYSVDKHTTTVHLTTEAEFDALLEQFCDYSESGKSVSFRNVHQTSQGHSTKNVNHFSTTNREEMKAWMRQMEDAGMTVTVTYDHNTGTYNGTAYATVPQPPLPSGELITYECDQMNDFGYIWSFDTINHRVYITLHNTVQYSTIPDYPVGVFEYCHAEDVNTPCAYRLIDSWGDTAGLYILEFGGSFDFCGSDTLHYNTNPLGYPATLVRTNEWQTYLSVDDVSGASIVMHVNIHAIEADPVQYVGQANSNYDDGIAYGSGRFVMKRTNTIDYGGTLLYFMDLDFTPYNNDLVSNVLIEGEPIVDDHFTISYGLWHDIYAPGGIGITSQDFFYRL